MKKFKLFLSIAILFIALPTAMPAYDFLTLSLQWPPTVNPGGQFRRHLPLNFTIHGVWPDSYGVPPQQCHPIHNGRRLQCRLSHNGAPLPPCCPSQLYVTFQKSNLLQRLEVSWPNLQGHNNQGFWQYEWETHGGYSRADYGQTDFFTLGLDLKDQYDLYEHLLSNHFIRWNGNSFIGWNGNLTRLNQSIYSYIHKRVQFVCNQLGELMEIRICFKKWTLEPMDCPQPNLSCSYRVIIPPW